MAGGKYVFDPKKEKEVDARVRYIIDWVKSHNSNVVIDQTNCKMSYITKFLLDFKETHNIKLVVLWQPLWKLYIRNYWRWLHTGKWIPLSTIKTMNRNQKKMDWRSIETNYSIKHIR